MSKTGKRLALGALIVGAFGYIAGILTAPKSGKQTRADIGQFRDKSVAEAEKQLKKLHTELNSLIGEAELYATDKDKRHDVNGEVVERAGVARQKAREILSALHDGSADDRDLDKALSEAQKAIKALQKYLKK